MRWDTKWSAVSAVAAVLGLVVPIVLFAVTRDSKDLSVETVSRAVLIDLASPGLSSLKLTHNDLPVSRLTVATFEVRNTGTRPIERGDFERPLLMRFREQEDVLAIAVSERTPPELSPVINVQRDSVTIAPLLLNPGDWFRLTAQLRGDFSEPAVEGRISGVGRIARRTLAEPRSSRAMKILSCGVIAFAAYMYSAGFTQSVLQHARGWLARVESVALTLILGIASGGLVAAAIVLDPDILAYKWPFAAGALPVSFVIFYLSRRRFAALFPARRVVPGSESST